MSSYNITCSSIIFFLFFAKVALAAQCPGTPISEKDIAPWNIDISRNGPLPDGQGTPLAGEKIYQEKCSNCHGPTADGVSGIYPALRGGIGSLTSRKPLRTIGSFWPYPESVLDYVRRAMPLDSPQSLSNDDLYAVVSYLFYINHIVSKDFVLDSKTIAGIEMPNRKGFIETGEGRERPTVAGTAGENRLMDCRSKAGGRK